MVTGLNIERPMGPWRLGCILLQPWNWKGVIFRSFIALPNDNQLMNLSVRQASTCHFPITAYKVRESGPIFNQNLKLYLEVCCRTVKDTLIHTGSCLELDKTRLVQGNGGTKSWFNLIYFWLNMALILLTVHTSLLLFLTKCSYMVHI